MTTRQLGRSGIATIPFVLGGNVFGWTATRDASFAVLDAFTDGGGTLIDTADVYYAKAPGNRGGESETIIGEWLRSTGRREEVYIATKVGLLPGKGGQGLMPSRIAAAADESLRRLQVDVIDLYFAHRDDPETPLEDTLEALDRLVRAGKVKALGASNYSTARLEAALEISAQNGWTRFSVVQPNYNLLVRDDYEGRLQDLVLSENLAAISYFGLASGYLTGKYRHEADLIGNRRAELLRPYFRGKGPQMLTVMDEIAAQTGASHAAIALAWVSTKPGIVAPIASATSTAQVAELLKSIELHLSADQINRLDAAARP